MKKKLQQIIEQLTVIQLQTKDEMKKWRIECAITELKRTKGDLPMRP
jgi:hypothetical protein